MSCLNCSKEIEFSFHVSVYPKNACTYTWEKKLPGYYYQKVYYDKKEKEIKVENKNTYIESSKLGLGAYETASNDTKIAMEEKVSKFVKKMLHKVKNELKEMKLEKVLPKKETLYFYLSNEIHAGSHTDKCFIKVCKECFDNESFSKLNYKLPMN